ncbi:hypothetical protein FN846DRAFT_891179 [Sphaerosporella brunnea]|uniref:Uncharacterized protein n=1 Tax=Sphaerosporella brunnea TaxID=1250544 RepID=A0A5J5EU01_9PEZI|nr:hypothetical protein FN846DRAFT_891179 [Sphaerosporella brunnea]
MKGMYSRCSEKPFINGVSIYTTHHGTSIAKREHEGTTEKRKSCFVHDSSASIANRTNQSVHKQEGTAHAHGASYTQLHQQHRCTLSLQREASTASRQSLIRDGQFAQISPFLETAALTPTPQARNRLGCVAVQVASRLETVLGHHDVSDIRPELS